MKDELDRLEAEHEQLDPLIAWVSDRSRPRRDRALALHDLQEFLRRVPGTARSERRSR